MITKQFVNLKEVFVVEKLVIKYPYRVTVLA